VTRRPTPEAGGPGYVLVRALSRFLLRLFYARIEVVGVENVPAAGALIVAANHHNSIVDAMLLLAVIPRCLRVLAKASLFRHPLIGPFLRAVGGVPVQRRDEPGHGSASNAALFAATTAALAAEGAILIFPEGRTQPEPSLQELRTGTARMLLAAEAASSGNLRVALLPVGLVFDEPGTFRAGRALVWVGPPVPTRDCLDDSSGRAARVLTDRLADALRAQIVEADDRRTLGLLVLVEELWREGRGSPRSDDAARAAWLQRAMQTYRSLARVAPDRVAAFRRALEAFDAESEKAGLAVEHLSRTYSFGGVARFTLREASSLLLAAPLALIGMLVHGLPYLLTVAAVRLIPHTAEEDATDKIAAGLVLYPLAWLAEAYAAYRLGGGVALAVFLAALLPTGFFALAWHRRLDHVASEARAFGRFLWDRDSPRRLREQRRALVAELDTLVRLAPEAWPSSAAAPEASRERRPE
jgi:glycerol-3-phosphate O-acyltransferase/dihydroxyacetone phosphate acyltransferase